MEEDGQHDYKTEPKNLVICCDSTGNDIFEKRPQRPRSSVAACVGRRRRDHDTSRSIGRDDGPDDYSLASSPCPRKSILRSTIPGGVPSNSVA